MMKVLIVDDSAMCRERIKALLSDLPDVEIVAEAGDARQAIKLSRRHQPDVVVLDLQMPGESGFEALRQLKSEQPAPAVIVLTNLAMPEYRTASLKDGAEFFFDKSYEFERVRTIIGSYHSVTQTPLEMHRS
jgi:DNA-binding NarL/FixJ family response regulator